MCVLTNLKGPELERSQYGTHEKLGARMGAARNLNPNANRVVRVYVDATKP
jgi:hypothetical protein